MSSDERDIFQFLKTWGTTFVGSNEIARRASTKKRFHDEPYWAKPILLAMVERGILEGDIQGRYRVKPVSRKKKSKWVAPDIAKILEESGIQSEPAPAEAAAAGAGAQGAGEPELGEDEYYEQL